MHCVEEEKKQGPCQKLIPLPIINHDNQLINSGEVAPQTSHTRNTQQASFIPWEASVREVHHSQTPSLFHCLE